MAKAVAEKLLIKPGTSVWCSDATRLDLLGPLPDGVRVADRIGETTTAVLFVEDAAALRALLGEHRRDLGRPAVLWIAYPKANRSDVNRDTLWPVVAEYGFRPITQVAVDDVWSALRFRPLREGEAQFSGGRS
jgi:hypothetical protein